MPLIAYLCKCTNLVKRFYRSAKDAPTAFKCDKCQEDMKKTLSPPSSTHKIVIDNGFQARAVEIVPNIVEINEERSKKDYRQD